MQCTNCNGTGKVPASGDLDQEKYRPCTKCQGTGEIEPGQCRYCKGKGTVTTYRGEEECIFCGGTGNDQMTGG